MGQFPHSKTVTLSNSGDARPTRQAELFVASTPALLLAQANWTAFGLVNPKTGMLFSPYSRIFDSVTDGATITVVRSS